MGKTVAITGTPGTGKTSVSEELAERLGYSYVDVNQVADSEEVNTEQDEERSALSVDTDSLVEALEEETEDEAVIDGHLSHYFPADIVIVLRCKPEKLRERLEEKGWNERKIEENLNSEKIDLILQEAVGLNDEVFEVDTTGRDIGEIVDIIQKIITGEDREEHQPGSVSWIL